MFVNLLRLLRRDELTWHGTEKRTFVGENGKISREDVRISFSCCAFSVAPSVYFGYMIGDRFIECACEDFPLINLTKEEMEEANREWGVFCREEGEKGACVVNKEGCVLVASLHYDSFANAVCVGVVQSDRKVARYAIRKCLYYETGMFVPVITSDHSVVFTEGPNGKYTVPSGTWDAGRWACFMPAALNIEGILNHCSYSQGLLWNDRSLGVSSVSLRSTEGAGAVIDWIAPVRVGSDFEVIKCSILRSNVTIRGSGFLRGSREEKTRAPKARLAEPVVECRLQSHNPSVLFKEGELNLKAVFDENELAKMDMNIAMPIISTSFLFKLGVAGRREHEIGKRGLFDDTEGCYIKEILGGQLPRGVLILCRGAVPAASLASGTGGIAAV